MRELTSESIIELWDAMCHRYEAKYVYKKTAWEMKLVAGFLDALGITDRDEFMKNYATTVGRTVYPNFKVGTKKVPFITQAMLASHEFNHIWLHDEMGTIQYNANYVGDVSERGLIEVDCYECDMTVYWHWHKATRGVGALPDIDMSKILKAYRCTGKKAGPALAKFEKAVKVIKKGGIASPTALDVIDFYEMME